MESSHAGPNLQTEGYSFSEEEFIAFYRHFYKFVVRVEAGSAATEPQQCQCMAHTVLRYSLVISQKINGRV